MAPVVDENNSAAVVQYNPKTVEMVLPESTNSIGSAVINGDRNSARRVLSFDEVCQTTGFVQNQPTKYPGNVRFIVQPVPADEIPSSVPSASLHSDTVFSFGGDGFSNDDIREAYGYLGQSDPQAQLTVRSMATIGLGSSNGRKINMRRVHTTGAESLFAPLLSPGGQQQDNNDTIHSQWPFSSMGITVNGKNGSGAVPPAGHVSSSSSNEDSSSSSSDDGAKNKRAKKKRSNRRFHHRRNHRHSGQVWGSRLEFILACVGFAAGLGNIWRFPYMAYTSGGGAFLIPYCIMVFFCGVPLQILELAVGQYTREGPVEAMRSICPLFAGVGVGMVLLSLMLSSYYSVAMAWSGLYLGLSFTTELPWTHCNNSWNTGACLRGPLPRAVTVTNETMEGNSSINVDVQQAGSTDQPAETTLLSAANWTTPGQEFFNKRILEMTNGIDDLGGIQWELVVCLLIVWILLCMTLRKSVRWSGKAVYVTATLPYVLLLALTARALTLDGADDGLRFFFHPDWSLLLKSEVWMNAMAQTFMSMGVAYGCMMAFASYNRFHCPFVRDALCISALNSLTSIVVGIIVFAALGHTSLIYGLPIDDVVTDGLSFSFVMYSTVVATMPFPQFWAVFLFVTIIFLGLDTQFATVEVVRLTLQRLVKQCCGLSSGVGRGSTKQIAKGSSRWVPDMVVISMCMACFVGALPYVTQGGIYLMQLTDFYICTLAITLLALGVGVSGGLLYGAGRVARNVREMTAHSPSPILVACWAAIAPVLITAVWIFHLADYVGRPLTFDHGRYTFPGWTVGLGCGVLAFILIGILVFAVMAVHQASGKRLIRKLVNATKSQMTECPCCRRGVRGLRYTHSAPQLNQDINGMGPNSAYAFAEFAEIHYPEDGAMTITSATSLPATFAAIPVIFASTLGFNSQHPQQQPIPDPEHSVTTNAQPD